MGSKRINQASSCIMGLNGYLMYMFVLCHLSWVSKYLYPLIGYKYYLTLIGSWPLAMMADFVVGVMVSLVPFLM